MNDVKVAIIPFRSELAEHIKKLNYEWLEKYFRVEQGDKKSLANPQEEIIGKGGHIYYALMNDDVVGTASLLNKGEGIYELGKMAVTAAAQGQGIGTLLLEHCISEAIKMGIKTIILYSNTSLQPAIHLYKKYGFTETTLEPGLYDRADIKMVKTLSGKL